MACNVQQPPPSEVVPLRLIKIPDFTFVFSRVFLSQRIRKTTTGIINVPQMISCRLLCVFDCLCTRV